MPASLNPYSTKGWTCLVREGHHHEVLTRKGNYSAFNGYHWTPSDYSAVACVETGKVWRTKAAYVDSLPDRADDGS